MEHPKSSADQPRSQASAIRKLTPAITQRRRLTQLKALSKQICEDVGYATHISTQRYWSNCQKQRSAASIKRKKAEARALLIGIDSPELSEVTERLWAASIWTSANWGRADPAIPVREEQQRLIEELRVELRKRTTAKRRAA
jgi:hypothetical protein